VRKFGVFRALAAAPVALGVLAAPFARAEGDAGAAAPATMVCDRVETPGRVRCEVEARVDAAEAIQWGDVVLVSTPPFVNALRGRIGPGDATVREDHVWRWALALVARERGAGEVSARIRLVVCRGDRCSPRVLPVTGKIVSGP
jgi:hypothetical protein